MSTTETRPSSSRVSLDSLIIDDEGVATESGLTPNTGRPALNHWFSPFAQAWSDLRSSNINWKLCIIIILLAVGFKLTLSLLLFDNDFFYGVCTSSGSFDPLNTQPNLYAISQFFQVNHGLGHLTFTQAKVIDTSWDLVRTPVFFLVRANVSLIYASTSQVVGRGGQMVLALVSWRLFADCAAVSLTKQPLSFAVFHAIFSDNEPSIVSAWRVTKSLIFQKRLASKLSSAYIIFSMLFILAWPTFVSSSTGYVPITQLVISEKGNDASPNLIPFSHFRPVAYTIQDFWRVDTLNTSLVVVDDSEECIYDPEEIECYLPWSISNYTSEYGFYGLSNKPSSFMGVDLDPPSLNIEAWYISSPYNNQVSELYGWDWNDPRSPNGSVYPFRDTSRLAWEYSNKIYWLKDINKRGSCTPETDRYQWGVSFLQIFIISILLSLWALGAFLMWLFYHSRLQATAKPEVPRGYRALEMLTRNINEQLQCRGFELAELTDHDAKRLIEKHLEGGRISLKGSIKVPSYQSWFWKEWPYAILSTSLFLSSLALYLSTYDGTSPFVAFNFTFSAFLGTCFAMDVGKTWGSRLVVFFLWAVFGTFLAVGFLYGFDWIFISSF
ncbi:hypothetical protein F5B22DRAFT_647485 [Xylaria bambusicola]|uniref:uncharacterized protein n=1 Tax=Xylaria bambusicola TaxID=326684 RepID=UPI002008CD70|nr:uncharacterized protein F5B22DRAFT_647485 [Xylaria bambusicola]KAI0514729.1 hypothetical protein F5B22DRAFT_647485 [Xylaria bambusicola]